jgi:cytochrome c oxidase subunit II
VEGRDLFLASGCGACHTIRGTPADGQLGPDLTHIGGRMSLGAGILPNNVGTIAGWIADTQHIKPGNKMPSFNIFSGAELRALAAYLASLE